MQSHSEVPGYGLQHTKYGFRGHNSAHNGILIHLVYTVWGMIEAKAGSAKQQQSDTGQEGGIFGPFCGLDDHVLSVLRSDWGLPGFVLIHHNHRMALSDVDIL